MSTHAIPTDEDVDLDVLAKGSPGFSGADLENLVNEAALIAAAMSWTKSTWRPSSTPRTKFRWDRKGAPW